MSMKYRILLLLALLISCAKKKSISDSYLRFFPQNADVILKINNLDRFESDLKNNNFISKTQTSALYKTIYEKVRPLTTLSLTANSALAFYEIGKGNFEFLLVTPSSPEMFATSALENITQETLSYENTSITGYQWEGTTFYTTLIEQKVVLSSSQLLLENAIRQGAGNSVPSSLQKLYDTADPNSPAAIFINLNRKNELVSAPLETKTKIDPDTFADWIALDIAAAQDALLLSGVVVARDSTTNFINLFKGTSPLVNKVATIAPQNADAILSFSSNEPDIFLRNQKQYLDLAVVENEALRAFDEFGIIYMNGTKVITITAVTNTELPDFITANTVGTSNYQSTEIIRLSASDFLINAFQPLIKEFSANFCTVFDNTFVFGQQETMLQTVIANKKSGFTFDKSPAYTAIKSELADEASILLIANAKGMENFVETQLTDEFQSNLGKPQWKEESFGAQFTADGDFFHFNMLLTQIQKAPSNTSVVPLFTLELDSDLATDPVFVENHRTRKQEIVVQDQDNVLYLISTDGKVLWKKQLEGRIRGKIHQVDIYKNGKLQLAFCTNNQFLVLDRNGKEVPPFTKRFEGGNVNPLAVFDYEKNRDYRFVVTQGRKVFMYNSRADIVSGFTFTEANSAILDAPDHFRMAKKDYLVFRLEDGTLKILHRAGNERIKVAEKIDFSDNGVFLYKNKFSTTNKKGVLHQIDPKGKLTATNFNLSQNHGMYATSKTLALMDENILSIKGKKITLELGVYTPPRIFYIYDKIYVTVTDIQNQKIHLYDSQGKSIPNFPVYGNSVIDMTDMDNDRKLELVAKDQENSIIVYTIN